MEDSEDQPIEDESSVKKEEEVPKEDDETAPLTDPAVDRGTNPTSELVPKDEGEARQQASSAATAAAVITTTPVKSKTKPVIGFHRSNSAPPPEQEELEEQSENLLSQEALVHAKLSPKPQVPDKSTSLHSVDPDALPSGTAEQQQLSSLSEREFEGLINSPTGQNVIAERSPGGRYVRFVEKLGSGATKDVYRAYDTTEGIEVAWNVVTLAGVPKAERNRIVNEVRLLERLYHHNIISFHGSWVNREKQEVNFITEILSSGTLKSFIDKVQVIRWKIAKRWARQILNGLAYLHEQDPPVIHRDLKCDNIFINGTSGDLRIGDFGLSTVHSNGKALSVLGTPEFMAPDLYEEASYDEKVDIYAFGMVLLEIFTKDIPYRECANPAQIYKKVIRGEPPESLARVRSKEARDFITLCLGYQDKETGKYVRPSAAELLQHPFLGTGVDDDSEVKVDPPLMERTIREEGPESESQRTQKGVTTKMEIPAPHRPPPAPEAAAEIRPDDVKVVSQTVHSPTPANKVPPPPLAARREGVPPRPRVMYQARQNSLTDESDQFEAMPDSEVNVGKNVKVMMGRGQELESSKDTPPTQAPTPPSSNAVAEPKQPTMASTSHDDTTGAGGIGKGMEQAPPPQVVQKHYLVSAVDIEEESPLARPYEDNILKLIIRLPVEGETQNVQFDFHLIKDDPVQVAKEMVEELEIPQEAVLEVSETISRFACNARMKQEKHASQLTWQQQQKDQQQMMPPSVQNQGIQQQPGMMQQQQRQALDDQQMTHGIVQQPGIMQPQHRSSLDDQNIAHGMVQQQSQRMNQNVPIQMAQGPAAGSEGYPINQQLLSYPQAASQGQPGERQHATAPPQILSSRSLSGGQLQQQQPPPPVYAQASAGAMPQDGNAAHQMQIQQQMMQQPQAPSQVPPAPSQKPQGQQPVSHEVAYSGAAHLQYAAAPSKVQQPQQQPAARRPIQTEPPGAPVQSQAQPPTTSQPAGSAVPLGRIPSRDSQSNPPTTVLLNGGGHDVSKPETGLSSKPKIRPLPTVESDTDGMETNDDEDDDDERALKEEIRRLDEDFQKNMLRAKKVFDSRMDNLQRSKEEREAQHLKTLEKHEKERAEFEKRLRQAEKEQNRRIEQLQQEWDQRRASLAKTKGGKTIPVAADVAQTGGNVTELSQSNVESLGSLAMSSSSREKLTTAPTHKKSASMNNSESSERSRSSSSSLNGDFGNNSELT